MRYAWCVMLCAMGISALASAQTRIVPALQLADREYGISGSYTKRKDVTNRSISELTALGRWGMIFGRIQIEAEGGYGRYRTEAIDSTGQNLRIAANALLNVPLGARTMAFALVGYGYARAWGSRTTGAITTSGKESYRFVHYGGGVKRLLAPNVGLRIEYRSQRGVRLKTTQQEHEQQMLLFGISVFQ